MFIKTLVGKGTFRKECSATTWIYRITTNVLPECPFAPGSDGSASRGLRPSINPTWRLPAVQPSASTNDSFCRRFLPKPTMFWAQAAIYVYVDGMSYAEAASVLGVSQDRSATVPPSFSANFVRLFEQASRATRTSALRLMRARLGRGFAEESSS